LITYLSFFRNFSELEYVVTKHAFKGGARNDGELIFGKGETIEVLEKYKDWWRGRISNRTGWFPGNYVRPAEDSRKKFIEYHQHLDLQINEDHENVNNFFFVLCFN